MNHMNYYVLKSKKTHHYYGRAGVHVNDYTSDQVVLFWLKQHAERFKSFIHASTHLAESEWEVDSVSIPLVQDKQIRSFQDEYRFLSNFHQCFVHFEGITYTSSEAAYQASKTNDLNDKVRISDLSPSEAKRAGTRLKLREDWSDDVRLDVMQRILFCKFTQNSDLMQKLVATYPSVLIEGNYWNDRFWGVCQGTGHNNLGRLLMCLRDEFRASK